MAKVQIKSEKLTPFGGIFRVMDLFDRHLSHIIDGTLGKRSVSIGYFQPSYGTSELASFIAHL